MEAAACKKVIRTYRKCEISLRLGISPCKLSRHDLSVLRGSSAAAENKLPISGAWALAEAHSLHTTVTFVISYFIFTRNKKSSADVTPFGGPSGVSRAEVDEAMRIVVTVPKEARY